MKYSLPLATINKILQFLGSQPFQQVEQIIAEIRKEAIAIEEEVKSEKVTPITPQVK